MTIAQRIVEIAEEIYDFGCAAEERGIRGEHDPVAVFTWAAPKGNPDLKRPLYEIRDDLVAVYQAKYDGVPNRQAVGDAMSVLEGKAKQARPITPDDDLRARMTTGVNTATELVALAREHYSFGVTVTGEVFAVPKDGPNIARSLRGGRKSLRADLAHRYFRSQGRAAGGNALSDALQVITGDAQSLDPTDVALRVARLPDGRLVLDLGREDGSVVIVGPTGWEVADRSPILFWRTNAMLPLPTPDRGGTLDDLWPLLNVPMGHEPLVAAWLVAALFPAIAHPVLLVRGEHGSAKSSAAETLTGLLDPCASQLRSVPRKAEDWVVACAASWVTCLDNVSSVQPWLQDSVCRAVTGEGLVRRALYTDSDVTVIAFRRVVAITSIDLGRLNGDLADRLLDVELDVIDESERVPEQTIKEKWRLLHPKVFGGLLDLASQVLGVLPGIRSTKLPRMADFARIVLAVDEVLGTDGYSAYAKQAGNTADTVIESDPVALAIRRMITSTWVGSAAELLAELGPSDDHLPRTWPETPAAMGGRLRRLAPAFRATGWTVEHDRTSDGRAWTLVPPHPRPRSVFDDEPPALRNDAPSTRPADIHGRGES